MLEKVHDELRVELMLEKVPVKLRELDGELREKLMLDKVPGKVHLKPMLNKYLGKCAEN